MKREIHLRVPSVACLIAWLGLASMVGLAAASQGVFAGRLSSMPATAVTALTMLGSGSVAATLDGDRLTVDGRFQDLNSPATSAHMHSAEKGLRGPAIFDLTVTNATTGSVKGTVTLDESMKQQLERGWFYVQIATEKNPEGHLRGWITKQIAKQSKT
jgi:hypothetical protein